MDVVKRVMDGELPADESSLIVREASRAVLFDEDALVALLFVAKHNYHKLPGGGIDEGEDQAQALVRECLEEVGAEIEVLGEVGMVVEFRSEWDFKQVSYCYHGKILSKGEPSFTQKELSEGFRVVWMSLQDAINQLEQESPENYAGSFIVQRDLALLRKAQQIIDEN